MNEVCRFFTGKPLVAGSVACIISPEDDLLRIISQTRSGGKRLLRSLRGVEVFVFSCSHLLPGVFSPKTVRVMILVIRSGIPLNRSWLPVIVALERHPCQTRLS